jgi:putative ABC transport system ATP-binding protein
MLALERVVKHYQAGGEQIRAVDGVTLAVAAGEMVALQGPSGSGKTTLLLLAAGLVKPDAGGVTFDGQNVGRFSDDEVAEYLQRDVGFIYQSFHLMARTSVLENAAMKLVLAGVGMREAQGLALPWLERLGLGGRLGHTPEQLSAGERQRVAIARALAGEPKLILADEPTGNLDSARSEELVTVLGELTRDGNAGVLLVTHDRDVAAAAERCYLIRDGRLRDEEPETQRLALGG